MSILDGMIASEDQLKAVIDLTSATVNKVLEQANLTPRQRSVIDLLAEGLSLADIFNITKEERDVMLAKGIRLLQLGESSKGRDLLVALYQLEPLDARVVYAIATSYQMEGNSEIAGKLYVDFLALDATNPDGYLRLGECFMAAREFGQAADCFEAAEAECSRGRGTAQTLDYARKMRAAVKDMAGASSH